MVSRRKHTFRHGLSTCDAVLPSLAGACAIESSREDTPITSFTSTDEHFITMRRLLQQTEERGQQRGRTSMAAEDGHPAGRQKRGVLEVPDGNGG